MQMHLGFSFPYIFFFSIRDIVRDIIAPNIAFFLHIYLMCLKFLVKKNNEDDYIFMKLFRAVFSRKSVSKANLFSIIIALVQPHEKFNVLLL